MQMEKHARKGIHIGFENDRTNHMKFKTKVHLVPHKGLTSSKTIFKKSQSLSFRNTNSCNCKRSDVYYSFFIFLLIINLQLTRI